MQDIHHQLDKYPQSLHIHFTYALNMIEVYQYSWNTGTGTTRLTLSVGALS